MSSFQLTEYLLWKTIKDREPVESIKQVFFKLPIKKEEIEYPTERICRVCTNPADISISDKVEGVNILSAIRIVANISISGTDCYPKHVCKKCLEELKVALTFKRKCQASDFMFRKSCSSATMLAHTSPPMVHHDFALILHQMKQRHIFIQDSSKFAHDMDKKNRKSESPSAPKRIVKKKPRPLRNRHKCKKCDLIFDTKELLLEHRLQHSCVSPPCPLCGKIVSNLSRHKKIVHLRTDKYTCHVCGKVSYSSGGLRNHLLIHSDKFEYSCSLCPYKGKQQAYLTLHMRVHTGERPYLCSECPAKFVNPSNLRKHQLTHSNKKFECNKCKKQFRLQKTLQEHFDAAHLNVRYRCSICGRDLWTRRKLLSHELRVHNREKRKLYEEMYKVIVNDEND